MLPIRDPEYMFDQSFNEQLEFNPHLLPNGGSYFPSTPTVFCPDGFHDLFLASNIIGITNATPTSSTRPTLPPLGDSAASVERQEGDGSRSRIRGVRKCRHSKIVTASGPRDRRMRLSTDVARSFFRLQDTLGFDKASKTVQWLLTMSKAAIGELGTLSPAELSACSNQSPKSESSSALVCQDSSTISNSKNKSSSTVTAAAAGQVKKTKARKGAVKPTRKVEYHSAPARESRAKARARARERTREKQRMTSSEFTKDDTSLNNLNPPSMEFANIEEDESRAPNSGWLNVAGDTAYEEVPMIGGGGSVLIPIFENGQHTMAIDDAGGIFEEQWDVDALSLYSTTTSLVASWDSYPNV